MTKRAIFAKRFIDNSGWADAIVRPLAGDASNRRYDRLTRQNGDCAVLMDADPSKGEDVLPFVSIANFLAQIGLSAPRILGEDQTNGFLLIEDLGDALFARVMTSTPALELPLYQSAAQVLAHLHLHKPPNLPRYDAKIGAELAALSFDWYQLGTCASVDVSARQRLLAAMQECLAVHDNVDPVLIQRDYHAENLLWLPDRVGAARVGLLDFQDAMSGHPSYDLVSVLQDARRDVSSEIEQQVLSSFINQTDREPNEFRAAYAAWGLQRNLRILGVFARLCLRDGKIHYVDLIPRVWDHIQTNLRHPNLAHIKPCLDGLPHPTHEILDGLRAKCATFQTA